MLLGLYTYISYVFIRTYLNIKTPQDAACIHVILRLNKLAVMSPVMTCLPQLCSAHAVSHEADR